MKTPLQTACRCLLVLLLTAVHIPQVQAQKIGIALFYEDSLSAIDIKVDSGKLAIVGKDEIIGAIRPGGQLRIERSGNALFLIQGLKVLGKYPEIKLLRAQANFLEAKFRAQTEAPLRTQLIPAQGKARPATYDGGFYIRPAYNELQIINLVSFDYYLAGVIEAESGFGARPEFYKAQAILARTYALKNLMRHQLEGFNLCDRVHCQAYKGRTGQNPAILKAVRQTRQEVVYGPDSGLIEAVFCANCGGQTASPEDIHWTARPYLKSRKDPYCVVRAQHSWEKQIPLEKWQAYFKAHGFSQPAPPPPNFFTERTSNRKIYYEWGNQRVSRLQLRHDWHLRSAFFSVVQQGNTILLDGRGYGHGVGFCQEGAMEMGKKGFNYKEILHFYYDNIHIDSFSGINDE